MTDIRFGCTRCGTALAAPDDMAGKLMECPECHQRLTVPGSWSGQAQPPPSPAYEGPSFPRAAETHPLALWSLILGIGGLVLGCCGLVLPILAIVFGHVALSKIKAEPDRYEGRGMAIAGLVMGYAGLVISIILSIVFGVIGAFGETVEGSGF
jgi:hypothetical protein